VLNAINAEDALIDDLVNAPTLTNVYLGPSVELISRSADDLRAGSVT
jgi:hypothetical protein